MLGRNISQGTSMAKQNFKKGWSNRPHGAWLDLISEQTVPLRPVSLLWAPLVLLRERDRERAILVKTKLDCTQPFFFHFLTTDWGSTLTNQWKKEANGLLRACALFIFSLKWVINIDRKEGEKKMAYIWSKFSSTSHPVETRAREGEHPMPRPSVGSPDQPFRFHLILYMRTVDRSAMGKKHSGRKATCRGEKTKVTHISVGE